MFDMHTPRMYKAWSLALAGCAVLGLLSDASVDKYKAAAIISMSIMSILLSLAECVMLIFVEYRKIYEAVTETIHAAQGLTPDQVSRMGAGLERLVATKSLSTKVTYAETVGASYNLYILNLPVSLNSLRYIAEGLLAGRPFSEGYWTDKSNPNRISSNKFRALQDEMERRKLILLRNSEHPEQGYDVTLSGKAAMRYIVMAAKSTPSSPSLPAS